MESIRYARALARSWWLIVIAVLAGGAGGYFVYHRTTPLYQSGVRLIVGTTSSTDQVSAGALTSARAASMAQIASTGPAVEDAIAKAGISSVGALGVQAGASGSFLTITVSDTNPEIAYKIAQAFPSTISDSLSRLSGQGVQGYRLTTLDAAGLATQPYEPNRNQDVGLGLAAGLVLGLALAILRETLNRSVRDSAGLAELTGLTVLGTVPRDAPKTLLPARTTPRSARAEAYRQIRTTLLSKTVHRPLVIAVTSASSGEGKTSVSCNVAAIFSRAGHRVAIVDADLRRPRVGGFFELGTGPGLSEVLRGTADLDDVTTVLDDGRLAVVPAGAPPADPAELIGSQKMVEVLRQLTNEYEFVFIDTPPVLPVTDALILAPLVDGMAFVARLQSTTDARIERALKALDRVSAKLIGIVPNQASASSDRESSYSYRYRSTADQPADPGFVAATPADPAHLLPIEQAETVPAVPPTASVEPAPAAQVSYAEIVPAVSPAAPVEPAPAAQVSYAEIVPAVSPAAPVEPAPAAPVSYAEPVPSLGHVEATAPTEPATSTQLGHANAVAEPAAEPPISEPIAADSNADQAPVTALTSTVAEPPKSGVARHRHVAEADDHVDDATVTDAVPIDQIATNDIPPYDDASVPQAPAEPSVSDPADTPVSGSETADPATVGDDASESDDGVAIFAPPPTTPSLPRAKSKTNAGRQSGRGRRRAR